MLHMNRKISSGASSLQSLRLCILQSIWGKLTRSFFLTRWHLFFFSSSFLPMGIRKKPRASETNVKLGKKIDSEEQLQCLYLFLSLIFGCASPADSSMGDAVQSEAYGSQGERRRSHHVGAAGRADDSRHRHTKVPLQEETVSSNESSVTPRICFQSGRLPLFSHPDRTIP